MGEAESASMRRITIVSQMDIVVKLYVYNELFCKGYLSLSYPENVMLTGKIMKNGSLLDEKNYCNGMYDFKLLCFNRLG